MALGLAPPWVAQAEGRGRSGHSPLGVRHRTRLSTHCVLGIEFNLISPTLRQS